MKNFMLRCKDHQAIKEGTILAASFILPMILLHLIFQGMGFYPSGEKSVLIMDMQGQYVEFFSSLKDIIGGDNSIFFNWSRSMGGNYIGLFAYYIASPLSLITLFFDTESLPLGVYLLTLLKIGASGLTFAIYTEYGLARKKGQFGTLLFSISYALISYNVVYSMCLMWLDGVIMLPLILLGIEQLVKKQKGTLYLISLAILFFSSYYTSYMVGIFAALYLAFRLITEWERGQGRNLAKIFMQFALNTILAFCFTAPIIIPTIRDLFDGKLSSGITIPGWEPKFDFTDFWNKLFTGQYDSITNDGLPSVYCGILILILAAIYLFQKRKWRERLGSIALLAFLAFSFYFSNLDFIWHGFQYPNWFPYRYAFLFSFVLIYMAVNAFAAIEIPKKKTYKNLYFVLTAIAVIIASINMSQNAKSMIDGLDQEFHYSDLKSYTEFIKSTKPLIASIQEKDSGFYRIEKNYEYSKNDAMLLGYHGMTHYSSTYNAYVNETTRQLGLAQTWFWNSGYGSTPVLDSIFDVKYILFNQQVPNLYNKLTTNEYNITAYENPDVLPIAFAAGHKKNPVFSADDPFQNQNNLLNCLAETNQNYFYPVVFNKTNREGGWDYTFTATSSHPVYLKMQPNDFDYADVYVNGEFAGNYFTSETSGILYLGQFKKGQQITVQCNTTNASAYAEYIYELDAEAYKQTMSQLKQGGIKLTDRGSGTLTGEITLDSGQNIFTSIPYSNGMKVKVDGEVVEGFRFAGAFLMIPAEAGTHTIEFSYQSPGFSTGILLFIIATLFTIFLYLLQRKKQWHIL